MLQDDVPLVLSRQLLSIFTQEVVHLETEKRKEAASQYALWLFTLDQPVADLDSAGCRALQMRSRAVSPSC